MDRSSDMDDSSFHDDSSGLDQRSSSSLHSDARSYSVDFDMVTDENEDQHDPDPDVDIDLEPPDTALNELPGYVTESYEGAGQILEKDAMPLSLLHQTRTMANPYHPFRCLDDWKLAKWLHTSALSKSRVDSLLRLKHDTGQALDIHNAITLEQLLLQLPDPQMQWICNNIIPESGNSTTPITIYYRDPLSAIRSLLSRPSLTEHIEFVPRKTKIYGNQFFSDIFTGEWAWRMQDSLSYGAALIPVLLKIQVEILSSEQKVRSLYLSIGNIKSAIRNDPSFHCWVNIGYIPLVEFLDAGHLNGVLQARLFHQSLRVILATLISTGRRRLIMSDATGAKRSCHPRVAVILAEYRDQTIINIARLGHSPTSTATHDQLGSADSQPPRTRQWIMTRLARASKIANPQDLQSYVSAAQDLGLNGVDTLFWKDLPDYEPNLCIAPDIEHGLLRFCRDHVLEWVKNLVGASELDARFKVLQPIVGMRHFSGGISHLSCPTIQEDKDIQSVLLATISGATNINMAVMKSLRAIHDFAYLARSQLHSTVNLFQLQYHLQDFHATKEVFVETGAKKNNRGDIVPHFNIPNLACLHEFFLHIPQLGTSPQFCFNIGENSSRNIRLVPLNLDHHDIRDQMAEMCKAADIEERVQLMDRYITWLYPSQRALSDINAPEEGVLVGSRPDITDKRLRTTAILYALPDLMASVKELLDGIPVETQDTVNERPIDIWNRLEIHRFSYTGVQRSVLALVVEALPPSAFLPNGQNHCALVNASEVQLYPCLNGHRVCQVRLIFRLHLGNAGHPMHQVPLVYVHWFSRSREKEKGIDMYTVQRHLDDTGKQLGGVIKLTSLNNRAQLIPKFGEIVRPVANRHNSLDVYNSFYLNPFADLETYSTIG